VNKFHLGFDKFQRYQIVEEIITSLRTKPQLRILDIGTPANYLSRFLPKDRIYTIDYQRAKSGRFIQSDALQLPFPDKAFDVAVSLDVLEHIPPRQRSRFLAEQARVAGDLLIVGAPFQAAEVELAERIAWEQIKTRYGIEHQFLTEHQRYGLPDLTGTVRWLERQGLSCITLPNGYLPNWLLMLLVDFHAERSKAPTALRRRVLELYNREYYPGDNREPSYRQIVVAAKEGMRLERLPERTTRPTTSAGSTAPLAPAILKLFDATVSNQVGDAVKAIEQKWQEERQGSAKRLQQEQQQHQRQLKAQERAAGVQARQLTREIEKLQQRGQREIERLNREIDALHLAYQQQLATQTQAAEQRLLTRQEQLAALEAQLATLRQAATTETDRLNTELRTVHLAYQQQLAQTEAHRTEAVAALDRHRQEAQQQVDAVRQATQQQIAELQTQATATTVAQAQAALQARATLEQAHQQQVVELQTQATAQAEALRREIDALHLAYQQQLATLRQETQTAQEQTRQQQLAEQTRLQTEIDRLHLAYQQQLATQTQAAEQRLLTRQEQLAALEAQLATLRQAATTETDRLNTELRTVHQAYQQQLARQADTALRDQRALQEAHDRDRYHAEETIEIFRTRYEAAIQEWQREVAALASQLAGTEHQLAERLHRVLRDRSDVLESRLSLVQRDVTHRLQHTTQHNEWLNRRVAEQQRTICEQQRILEAMEQRWKRLTRHPLIRWLLQQSEHRS